MNAPVKNHILCASIFISFLYCDDIFVILNLVIWFGLIVISIVVITVATVVAGAATACGLIFSKKKKTSFFYISIQYLSSNQARDFYAFLIFWFNFNDGWIYIVSIKSQNYIGSSGIGTQSTHTSQIYDIQCASVLAVLFLFVVVVVYQSKVIMAQHWPATTIWSQ